MSSEVAGALIAAAACVITAPLLARLTLSAPDGEARDWWRGRPASGQRVAVTAVTGAVLGALGGATAGTSLLLAPFLLLALVGAPLVVIDYEVHRLPNRLVFAVAIGAPVLAVLVAAHDDDWHRLLRAAEGALAVFAALLVLRLISPRSFGYGDVKLGGILGGYLGWFGWAHVYYGIFAGFVLGAVVAVLMLAARRATMKTAIPFGPMLIVGALAVLAFDLVPSFS